MYIGNTKAAAPAKAGSRELYKLRLVKLHGHWLEKKTILWKKNEHSRWLYSSIQGAIFPRLIITSSGVDTQVTSESVLIRFESVPMFVSTFSFLWHSYKCQVSCRVSSLGDFKECIVFVLGLIDCPFLNKYVFPTGHVSSVLTKYTLLRKSSSIIQAMYMNDFSVLFFIIINHSGKGNTQLFHQIEP